MEGDGVAWEVYWLYIEQLISNSSDGTMHFAAIVQKQLGEEDFKKVGKILFHFYINYSLPYFL